MDEQKKPEDPSEKVNPETPRKPYQKPALKVHGNLRLISQMS